MRGIALDPAALPRHSKGMRFPRILVCLLAACHPASALPDGFKQVRTSGEITEYQLESNGLTVLLAPVKDATVATFSVTYRIGSRNESYGTTGATHLLEHLMFKGTARHSKEAGNGFDQMLEGLGAMTNATTWLDRTEYTTTLAPEHLPVIIGLEADRMRNLRLREEDFRPEMSVVMDEFRTGEDDPVLALDRGIWATAFQAHPYRHSVIGWRSDVVNMPLQKLREFYDTYYWPDHATVSVVGNFAEDEVLEEIRRCYGPIGRAPRPVPPVYTVEPVQNGLRRFEMKRHGEAAVVTLAFKSPPATHPDFPALRVLCDLLADGQDSDFYHELTEAGLTVDVIAEVDATLDPSLLRITAELASEDGHEKVEDIVFGILDDVIAKGVTAEQVRVALAQLAAKASYDRDGTEPIAVALTDGISAGDWTLFHRLPAAVSKVDAAAVQRVAKVWLREDRCTIGWLVPDDSAVPDELASPADQAPATTAKPAPLILPELPAARPSPKPGIAERAGRTRTAGLDLIVCPVGSKNVVHLGGSLALGNPSDRPRAMFTAAMLEFGTAEHDADTIGKMLDEVGAELEFEVSGGFLYWTGRCLADDLPRLLTILSGQLRTPVFPSEDLESVRKQLVSEARLAGDDTGSQAGLAYNRAVHPPEHPARLPDEGETVKVLKSLMRQDLVDFHREWFGPASAIVVVAGDVDPARCRAEIDKAFGGWSGGKPAPSPAPVPGAEGPRMLAIPLAGKESSRVLIGQPCALDGAHPDALALSLAAAALGDGFTSRLVSTVRDAEGLTYAVDSYLSFDPSGRPTWQIAATFAPDLLERGIASIRRELDRWLEDGLNESEFAYRRGAMTGAHRVGLATSEGLAEALHATARRGLPLSWLDDQEAQLRALSRDDVNRVIRQYLEPARMVEVRCGDLPPPAAGTPRR